jgi:teichuronic acid biosynthesis glycosyltransferase TuaG
MDAYSLMTEPLVSVIMPAFNAEKYIGESIESVIVQTYPHWELVVVDDGSTDHTANIIRQYQTAEPRIKYFYQQNGRQGKAKNRGIRESKGIYIAFLDTDDLWLPEKLEVSLRELQNGEFSLLFTDSYVFSDDEPRKAASLKRMGVGEAVYKGRSALLKFLEYNQIPNLTVIVKKETILGAGDFTSLAVAEEYEMWLRLLSGGAIFKAISAPLAMYRLHQASITATDRQATFEVIGIIKDFGRKHAGYAAHTKKIAREKLKYWLYYCDDRSAARFRVLITGLFEPFRWALFYGMSFLLPLDQLRKVAHRLF